MKTLFIDTSSSFLDIALILDGVVYEKKINSINEHSKYAMSVIEEIFNSNNVKPEDINQIMVINGPGSFTGLRIGVTIAKIYGWSLNINVIPISTLKAYALSNSNYDYYVCLLDARRNYVYGSIYDSNYNAVLDDKYISIEELNDKISNLKGNILIVGDININSNYDYVKPELDIKNIYEYYKKNEGVNAHKLVPKYLKMVEAEERLGCDNND
jgi:tRNA threonylcarbamoyladenosine biosynthesis protein TsaB